MSSRVGPGPVVRLLSCLIVSAALILTVTALLRAGPAAGAQPTQQVPVDSVPPPAGASDDPHAPETLTILQPWERKPFSSGGRALQPPPASRSRASQLDFDTAGSYFPLQPGDPLIVARYWMDGWNDVFGYDAITDSHILITVTHPTSDIIATAGTMAGACEGCGPTDYQVELAPGTLTPGVTVTVNFAEAGIEVVEVVEITGDPDIANDRVVGTAPAGGTLDAYVERPGDRADIPGDVTVDASGVYTLDFGAQSWSIQPGDTFHVYYHAPGDHLVESIFWLPVPELGINKWQMGGFARPGGKLVYGLVYWNNGNGVATDTLIVDTLPPSTSWAGDTSGTTPDIGAGGVITWHVGDLQGWGNWDVFAVTLDVDSSVLTGSQVITGNCAVITTTAGDIDPNNNAWCSGPVDVWESDVGINVDKWPSPWDPAPGQEFDYTIRWCTDYGANFGPVWLTDTLPVSTTVVGWNTSEWPQALWTEVVTTGGQFALYAPGLPGDWCQHINLRLSLDPEAPLGTPLDNHVVVTTPDDAQPENNERLNQDATVSGERYDLTLSKSMHAGVPVPGGGINYFIWYANQGNTASRVWVTETVPAGLTYEYAHWGGGQPGENEPLPDPAMVGNALVWDLGELGVNESRWFHVQMAISDTLEVGDQVANCAVIGTDGEDGAPENNESCYSVTLNPNGPNLNVSKEHWWNGDGQLGYRVMFYNLGDETVADVRITDTLPVDTAWDGWWNLNDLPYDRLVETTENSDLLAWHFSELYPGERGILEFNANLDEVVIGEPLRWYTNTVEITPLTDDVDPADNEYSDVAFSGGEVRRAEMWLGTEHADMWGEGVPGTVTITTPYTQVTVWGDPGCNGCWNTGDTGDIGPIWPGDTIVVEAGEGVQPVTIVVPDPFSAEADSTTDQVWGQIDSVANEQVRVEDYWNGGYQEVWTNAAGEYVATYADIPRGAEGHVRYLTMRDYADVMFHRRFAAQDLLVRVDYSEDGVDGNYEPGHTGWITVTDSIGSIKATVEITTETWPWWGGSSGFSTHHHEWYPEQPDVVPGDWVYATLDNDDSTNVQVGTIDATLDVAYDLITGTLDVWWYSEELFVRCEIHENNAPGIDVGYIAPVGEEFVCDFRGRWDITPGQQVVVVYVEPDGDQVQYRPANPAPYLRVQKGLDGNRVAEGGNAVFSVQYRNEGDAPAPDVVITETLQGMTYLTDTSGFAHTGSGNQVVWDLGTVDPGDWIWFNLFAEVTASVGEHVTNTAEIATSDPFDQGDDWEKRAEWSDEVAGNDTYLNVGKWAWTGDPAPDGDVVFSVNTCSYGSTGSTEVTVTDTLPLSLTLQYWWAQHPGWYEVSSSDHQLVVARPSMPAGWCSEVYLRAKVDAAAWPGMPISNTATITAANDLSSDDNEAPWWGQVGNPHTNLSLNKNWGSGQLVPGGTLQYWVYIHNNGNQPVGAFTITETLPISTSLAWIWRQDQSGQYFVTPTHVGTNQLVWEVAEGLDSGYSANYEVGLMVDPDAVPGTVLVNTAEATCLSGEDTCDDNASSWTETLRDHGPNLRVRKEGQWDDGGENTRRAGYWLTVENVGDEAVHDVTVTDTYPTDMVLDGGVGGNFWQWWDWRDNGDHFTITLELLEPGWSPGFNFGLIANTEPLPFGLVFTNTAEVTLVGSDTNPDDNVDTVTLTTGPDLWVQKTLVGGDLLPGELVTFSLRFGNDHQGHEWWWNTQGSVWLTDTLPSGFEFITATRRSWGWAPYAPDRDDGTHVAWDTGGMPAGQEDELLVTLRIPPTATGLDTFSNEAEVASSEPVSDTEPFYTNNTSRATFAIDLPHFEVSKAYESNRVAGMPVTYTLDVVNTGNSTATSVVLTDTVPGGLTNVQTNGSAAAGLVTWNLGSLTAQGGTATGWFRGNLPCTVGTVTNVDYGVTSAEGPSATGVPVQLTVLAPALTAGFEASALSVVQGTTVDFTDASTTDGTGIVSWAWDFDDGDTSTDQNPTHTFDAVDTYQVKLTVTDGCGFTDDATLTIIVTSACTPLASADFTFAPEHPLINTAVAFNATTAPLNATGPITYSWTFGDGQTATVTTPAVQHTYASDGAKSVMLTAYNLCTPEGVTATDTVTVKLYEVYLPLVMRAP